MKKIKVLAAIVSIGAMMLASRGAWADTWTDASGNVWTYSTNGVSATVSAVSFETTALAIPSVLVGKPVTAFSAGVFAGKARAVRVTIPATVTAIPAEAFLNCGNLKAVTIQGEGLKSIGYRAFAGCYNLEAFVMPNSVTSLGQGVFSGCSSMVSVTIGDGITEVVGVSYAGSVYSVGNGEYSDYEAPTLRGSYANGLFYNCASLKTVNWGKNVKTIGNIAFLNCSALESVTIPDTVTSIGCHAFLGCTNLGNVKIGNGVTAIGRMAFRALPNLTKVTFGSKVNSIGVQAFQDCVNLQNFTLPDTIQYLRHRCFAGCNKALTAVTIPTNKDELETELGEGVFSGCSKLATVTLGDTVVTLTGVSYAGSVYSVGNGEYSDYEAPTLRGSYANGLFYNCTSLKTINWGANVKTIGNVAFLNCSALETVTVPDTVTSIGCHAFLGCTNLGNVKIGNGVTAIGRMAFRALPNLTKMTFGSKVNGIGVQAFQDCVNLQNFTLPDTIQYIRYRAFAGCNKALTAVTIPTNKDELETELGEGVFSGCSKLATVTLGDTVVTLTGVSYAGSVYSVGNGEYSDYEAPTLRGSYANGLFYNCTSLKTINWGANVKTIGNVAFLNCSALETVTVPDTVTSIGCHAFLGCTNLGNVKIGNGVTTVGRMAFRALPNLTKVTFGVKVNEIQQQAFQDCVNLQNFTLPATLQYLRYRCFAGCSKAMTAVTIPTNRDELETELEEGVFSGCSKLVTVTFGDTVVTLTGVSYAGSVYSVGNGEYSDYEAPTLRGSYADGLFYNCTSLKTINWGAGIKEIGNIAFLNCTSLTDLTLPASITDIGNHAFFGCSSLKTVIVKGSVNSIGRRAFANCKALHYVDFQGDTMDFEPGAGIFDSDKPAITVYAKTGSTGWTGVAEVGGLPESGTWCGARITYAPPPEGADNPYDFYLVTPTCYYESWPAPVMVTSVRFEEDEDVPELETTFREGSPIYLSYAYDEYWRGEAFNVTNRIILSGAKSGTVDYVHKWGAHETADYGWKANATPELLQNLEPGEYTLTLQLNADNRLKETDYANNFTSIVFTVTGTPRYTVSFNANGGDGTMVPQTFTNGVAQALSSNEFAKADFVFTGWAMNASGPVVYSDMQSIAVSADMTLFAQWTEKNETPPYGTPIFTIEDGVLIAVDLNGATDIEIPESVTNVAGEVFYQCEELKSVTIPASVRYIGAHAFAYCTSLREVVFEEGSAKLTLVYPFSHTALTELHLPARWNDRSNGNPFEFCGALTNATIAPDNSTFAIVNGLLLSADGKTLYGALSGLSAVDIPESVETIAYRSLYGLSNVEEIVIPDTVLELDDQCISTCYSLKSVRIEGNVALLGLADHHPLITSCPNLNAVYFSGNAPTGDAQYMYASDISGDLVTYVTHQSTGWGVNIPGTWNGRRIEYVEGDVWTVTFNPNGGSVRESERTVFSGAAVGELPMPVRAGHVFAGWWTAASGGTQISDSTKVTANVTYYARWTINRHNVTLVLNGGDGDGSVTVDYGTKVGDLPVPTREGYEFIGWFTAANGGRWMADDELVTGDLILYAIWVKTQNELWPDGVDGPAPSAAASEYNGYLYDEESGAVKGTIQVKIGKPNAKTGLATAKATVVIGAKKVSLKGADMGKAAIEKDGQTEIELVGKGAEACSVTLGTDGLSGHYGAYRINGSRNFFASKDKAELSAANAILSKWLGSFMVVWDGGSLSVNIAAKGKVKVSGTLADGKTKVSANTVLLVGDEWSCVSAAVPKANLAFVLWLSHDGRTIEAEGLGDDVHVGLPGTLANGAAFHVDVDEFAAVFGQAMLPYLPDGVSVTQKGAKWTLPKAGKVVYKNGALDETKLGENPCGLKLTYTAKSGTFKGSFKVYAEVKGKPKATTVNVTGFLLNGVGYGTATVKGKDSVAVSIE